MTEAEWLASASVHETVPRQLGPAGFAVRPARLTAPRPLHLAVPALSRV
jgi:hypothetical protein